MHNFKTSQDVSKKVKVGILALGLMVSATSFAVVVDGMCSQVMASEKEQEQGETTENLVKTEEVKYDFDSIKKRIEIANQELKTTALKYVPIGSKPDEKTTVSIVKAMHSYSETINKPDINEILAIVREILNPEKRNKDEKLSDFSSFIQSQVNESLSKKISSLVDVYLQKIKDLKSLDTQKDLKKSHELCKEIEKTLFEMSFMYDMNRANDYLQILSQIWEKHKSTNTTIEDNKKSQATKLEETKKQADTEADTIFSKDTNSIEQFFKLYPTDGNLTLEASTKEELIKTKTLFVEQINKQIKSTQEDMLTKISDERNKKKTENQKIFDESTTKNNETYEKSVSSNKDMLETAKKNIKSIFDDYSMTTLGVIGSKITRAWNEGTFSRLDLTPEEFIKKSVPESMVKEFTDNLETYRKNIQESIVKDLYKKLKDNAFDSKEQKDKIFEDGYSVEGFMAFLGIDKDSIEKGKQ